MTVSIWQIADTPQIVHHRDVVIGAGLVGGATAQALAERGRDVAIVDARHPAAGASGRNAGFVMTNQRSHYPDLVAERGRDAARELFGLVRDNVRTMRTLAEGFGLALDPAPIRLARDPDYAAVLEAWARALEADGFAVDFGHGDPLDLGHLAWMRIPGDFCTQPARLAEGLVAASGAALYGDNEVYRLEIDRSAPVAQRVRVRGRRVDLVCERVWICLNGYAGALDPWLAARVQPTRGQVVLTAPLAPGRVAAAGISGLGYFRQLGDGRVLMGGARALFEAAEYTAADWNTDPVTETLAGEVRRLLGADDLPIDHRWAGTQGFTADRSAIVGHLPDRPAVWFAVGFSGYGNSLGVTAARRMVEAALDGSALGPLDAARLA